MSDINKNILPVCKYCGLNPPGCGQCTWSGKADDMQTKKIVQKEHILQTVLKKWL